MENSKNNALNFNDSRTKICVPLTGKTDSELIEQAQAVQRTTCDLVEWRVDLFDGVNNIERVIQIAHQLKAVLAPLPLLFTFRTINEGGDCPLSDTDYLLLNTALIKTGIIDFIDVELFIGEAIVKAIIQLAHQYQVHVMMSNHDFHATPSETEIIHRLCKMQQFGADIAKIAVMPNSAADVLILLSATNQMKQLHTQLPIITISMGKLGLISRLAGGVFGSAMTFGVVGQPSAPGQIDIDKLQPILDLLSLSE